MKSYTDTDQSIALSKILPLDSADMNYCNVCLKGVMYADSFKAGLSSYKDATKMNQENIDFFLNGTNYTGIIAWEVLPCWSLAALLGVLPFPQLSKDKLGSGKVGWMVSVYPNDCRYDSCWHDNPVDACYEMIIKLNELKML